MMKRVDISFVQPGSIAQGDCFSEKGDLLISKGVTITERHLAMLMRRNVLDLYIKADDEEELDRHLEKEMSLPALDAEIERPLPPPPPRHAPPPPRLPAIPGIVEIKSGAAGLAQLKESRLAVDLDRRIVETATSGLPEGVSLESRSRQITPAERTGGYKKEVHSQYGDAVAETAQVLHLLAAGELSDARPLRSIVERFVKIFVSDRNILLNLSATRQAGAEYLYNHSLNVCLLAMNIAAASGYSEEQVKEISMGALVHDVGMLLVPESIRHKTTKLTPDELYEVQKHPILGLHILEKTRGLPESVRFVSYQVHERASGVGYPKQRTARFIHRFAKLVQIADMYEALASPRPHREACIPYKAMESIVKMTSAGLVADDFVKSFLTYASLFPVGSLVQLSDNTVARVVATNRQAYSRPVLSVLTDSTGARLPQEAIRQFDSNRSREPGIAKALPSDYLKGLEIMDGF